MFGIWRTYRAIKFLFTGPVILVFLFFVNLLSSPGHWWVQWAALGIGLAWFICLFRVIRMMFLLGGLAALIAFLRKR